MPRPHHFLLFLSLLSLSTATSCWQPSEGLCSACFDHLELRVYHTYKTSDVYTYVLNGDSYKLQVPSTDNDYDRYRIFKFPETPETMSIQVYKGDTLRLDTTVTPFYEPGYDECMGDINLECKVALESVYVDEVLEESAD